MHDVASNHSGISWMFGVFFWLAIVVAAVVFVKSAFKSSDK